MVHTAVVQAAFGFGVVNGLQEFEGVGLLPPPPPREFVIGSITGIDNTDDEDTTGAVLVAIMDGILGATFFSRSTEGLSLQLNKSLLRGPRIPALLDFLDRIILFEICHRTSASCVTWPKYPVGFSPMETCSCATSSP